jgi:hypothetical protein
MDLQQLQDDLPTLSETALIETQENVELSPVATGILSPAEVAEMVGKVEVGIARQKQLFRYLAIVPALLAPTLIALLFLLRNRLGRDVFIEWTSQPTILFIFVSILFSAPTLIALGLKKQAKRLDSTSQRLSESQDLTLVGPLIDLLSVDNVTVRKNAVRALTTLLLTLQPENAGLISASQRSRLIHYLNMNPEMFLYKDVQDFFKPARLEKEVNRRAIDFRVAILQSYASIGGAQELPTVRKLAANTLSTPAQIRLREAAQEVLESVERRAETERRHGVLLRPTGAAGTDGSKLLQPADTAGESDFMKLLRSPEQSE